MNSMQTNQMHKPTKAVRRGRSFRRGAVALGLGAVAGLLVAAPGSAFAAAKKAQPVKTPTTGKPIATSVPAPAAAPIENIVIPAPAAVSPSGAFLPPPVTVVAAAKTKKTPVFESILAKTPFVTFDNKTNFSGRHVFIVQAKEGDFYKVLLPMRPNGRSGFVKATDVQLYQHDYAVVVSLSKKTLTVFKAGAEVMSESVGVGTAQYPTPTGSFFMRELARPRNPNGAYGPWAFGLSGYSNVLQKFGRGDGQIGIHGTNEPKKLGTQVSHGCIRMRNDAVTKLAKTLPQGVPVQIVA